MLLKKKEMLLCIEFEFKVRKRFSVFFFSRRRAGRNSHLAPLPPRCLHCWGRPHLKARNFASVILEW